jgi:hypothetical protein
MVKKFFYLLFLSLLVAAGVKIYFFIQKGYWDGQNRLNLLLKGPPSYLVSLVPADHQVIWQSLDTSPPEVLVDLSYEIDNYCFQEEKQIKSCLLSQFAHRLNSWDNWRFWWYVYRLPPAKISEVKKTANYFRDQAMIKDGFSLVVINTTTRSGLAAKIAQLITNSGGQVVRITDEARTLPFCQIKTERGLATSYTVRKLIKLLHCGLLLGSVENERAEVVIRLGEQSWADF